MAIRTFDLPEKAAAQMISLAPFVGLTISSWRDGAYATGDLLVQTLKALSSLHVEVDRAYLGWEIIMNVVELTEMVATVWLNRRSPTKIPAHRTSNAQIEKFWKSARSGSVPKTEINAFLRLEGAQGFSVRGQRTVRALASVAENVAELLRSIAIFWLEHADAARWFRHFPASLTPEETWRVDQSRSAQDEFITRFGKFDDALEFVTRLDENTFTHTLVTLTEARNAVHLGDGAIQLIMNWLANSGLDPNQPKRLRHIFPIFAQRLSDDDRAALLAAGNYVLDIN